MIIIINFQMNSLHFGKLALEYGETQEDVTFSVGPKGEQEEVKSSVFVLSTLSPIFRSMFEAETWKGHQDQVIPLRDIQPKVFRSFLKVSHHFFLIQIRLNKYIIFNFQHKT